MTSWKPILNRNKAVFNNKLFPNNFRLLIIGSSGCGKNVLLLKMLLEEGFLDYNNLIFYSTTINQPEVQLLKYGFENNLSKESLIDIFNNQDTLPKEVFTPSDIIDWYIENACANEGYEESREINKGVARKINNDTEFLTKSTKSTKFKPEKISVLFSNRPEDILYCDSLPKDKKNLVIFDDVVNMKNQEIQKSYFTRGRHNNCNVIYISQTYYALDKNSIRNNSNCFIFFKLNHRDKNMIYNDLFSEVVPNKAMFDGEVDYHWKDKYNYIYLDRDAGEIMKTIF